MRPSLHFCELRVPWLSRLLRMKRKRSYVLLPNTLKSMLFLNDRSIASSFFVFFSFFFVAFFNVFFIFCSRDKLTYDTYSFFLSLSTKQDSKFISIASHTKTMHRVFYQTIFRSRHSQRDERLCERLSNYCFYNYFTIDKRKKKAVPQVMRYTTLSTPQFAFLPGARSILELVHSYSVKY